MQEPEMKSAGLSTWRHHLPALVVYSICALIVVSGIFRVDLLVTHMQTGDAMINTYVLNWGQHILWQAPWHYLDAPVFYPETNALALSSSNRFLAAITAPLRLFGNPVFSYNAAMVIAVLLSGFSMYFVVWKLFGHRRAAIIAALIFSCNGDIIWHLPGHPNIIAPYFIPIVFFCWVRLRQSEKPLWALACGVSLLGQMYSSWYLGTIALGGMTLLWLADIIIRRGRFQKRDAWLWLCLFVVMILVYVHTIPYRDMAERHVNTRGLHEATFLSADFTEYLLPPRQEMRNMTLPGKVIARMSNPSSRAENSQFFGWIPWIFALVGIAVAWKAFRRKTEAKADDPTRVVFEATLLGLFGIVFSFGPFLWLGDGTLTKIPLPFLGMFQALPPLRFIRVPARFAVLASFGVSICAAYALINWRAFNFAACRRRIVITALLLAVIIIEYMPISGLPMYPYASSARKAISGNSELGMLAPIPFNDYRFLMDISNGFPATPSGWQGGLVNVRYNTLVDMIKAMPFDDKLVYFAAYGVDGVVVYEEENLQAARESEYLELIEEWGGDFYEVGALYRLNVRDESAVLAAKREIESLPTEPPLAQVAGIPDDANALLEQPIEVVANGLEASISIEIPSLPLGEIGAVYVRQRVKDPGVDFTEAKLVALDESQENFALVRKVFFESDGESKVIRFDFGDVSFVDGKQMINALILHSTTTAFPYQSIVVEQVAIQRKD